MSPKLDCFWTAGCNAPNPLGGEVWGRALLSTRDTSQNIYLTIAGLTSSTWLKVSEISSL